MYLKGIEINGAGFPTERYYPFNTPSIRLTDELIFRRPVVYFVGENGSGKSTLLEAIARRCGIHIWDKPRRHLAHNNPYETALAKYVTPHWANGRTSGSFFRAETFQDLADFLDDVALCDPGRLHYHGGQILNTLSHGEGILSYFRGRFGLRGLYFLDEPEAALSPWSQIEFLRLLQEFASRSEVQFVIATHSPLLLACPNAQIYWFQPTGIKEISYEETTHFQLYRAFLNNRAQFLCAEPKEEVM
jgi:predicted ATPase